MKYTGKEKVVMIPNGTEEIESSAFWDNQFIEEVIIPDTVVNLGGDTFYNCRNLQTINISKNVRLWEITPFAGCPHLKLKISPRFLFMKTEFCIIGKKTVSFTVPLWATKRN